MSRGQSIIVPAGLVGGYVNASGTTKLCQCKLGTRMKDRSHPLPMASDADIRAAKEINAESCKEISLLLENGLKPSAVLTDFLQINYARNSVNMAIGNIAGASNAIVRMSKENPEGFREINTLQNAAIDSLAEGKTEPLEKLLQLINSAVEGEQ